MSFFHFYIILLILKSPESLASFERVLTYFRNLHTMGPLHGSYQLYKGSVGSWVLMSDIDGLIGVDISPLLYSWVTSVDFFTFCSNSLRIYTSTESRSH